MLSVPVTLMQLIVKFAPVFSKRVWTHAQILVVGALLAPGKRTVTAVLRVMGLSQEQHFQNYHRVLNRARWSSLALARVLLDMVVRTFVPAGPVVIGIDDTLERRRGEKIKAKGIYRDPVRSSHSHVVKASGLRWLCAMVLTEIPWAGRVNRVRRRPRRRARRSIIFARAAYRPAVHTHCACRLPTPLLQCTWGGISASKGSLHRRSLWSTQGLPSLGLPSLIASPGLFPFRLSPNEARSRRGKLPNATRILLCQGRIGGTGKRLGKFRHVDDQTIDPITPW